MTSDPASQRVEALLSWWPSVRTVRDELPWRTTRDPWLTLMAEFMLAQTQTARVAKRYVEMAERFPTPSACAKAAQREVVECWVGLGYNRRAVALHQSAKAIVSRHDGEVPCNLDALLALPGVGPYTARAILAFAFGEHVGVVDTNIGRVLARAFAGSPMKGTRVQELADQLVPEDYSREWNLAIMDFGNLVCRAQRPHCDACVLSESLCSWRVEGHTANARIEDPAIGSAGVSKSQSRFEGSDRQGRGRLVRAALTVTITPDQLGAITGWPDDPARAQRVAEGLVSDGVLRRDSAGHYLLA